MHEVALADWILRRAMTKDKAAAVVGDLLEIRRQRSRAWFWSSVLKIWLRLTWRLPLAYLAAAYAFLVAQEKMGGEIYGRAFDDPHRVPIMWIPVLNSLLWAGMICWMIAAYMAVRHGLRDKIAQTALAYACVLTVPIFCWWQPVALLVCIMMGLFVPLMCMTSGELRKATLALIVTGVAGGAGVLFSFFSVALYQRLLKPGGWGSDDVARHPSVSWFFGIVFFATLLLTTRTCTAMRTWSIRRKHSEA